MSSKLSTSTVTLEDKIKAEAFRLGFSLCGITTPLPIPHFEVYTDWLNSGSHGGMSFLATTFHVETRKNSTALMPGALSILSLGWSYPLNAGDGFARVAGYTQLPDYHALLIEKLEPLKEFIISQVGREINTRAYTDSAPILEREIGSLAGLGWIGKNGCLISPKLGSNFLLAEMLLDVPLQADAPFAHDRCGSCTRCLEACPTGCILPNRTIDANRCVSYLTIEHRGEIPPSLRNSIGNWLFGCDICQAVCPWNQTSGNPSNEGFPVTFTEEELVGLLALSPGDFKTRFSQSSLARAKWQGLLRNAMIVIGNQGGRDWVEPLEVFLKSNSDPVLDATVRWALERVTITQPPKFDFGG